MKITKNHLENIIREELAGGVQGSNQEEINKILDLIENDPEFEILGQFKDKFLKYMQSGGDPLSALEAASPEWRPVQKTLKKLRTVVRSEDPKTPMGMPVAESKVKITKNHLENIIREELANAKKQLTEREYVSMTSDGGTVTGRLQSDTIIGADDRYYKLEDLVAAGEKSGLGMRKAPSWKAKKTGQFLEPADAPLGSNPDYTPLGEVYNAHVYQGSVDPYLVRAVDILEEEAEEMAQAAKTMAASPSHEPASGYADFVAKKAKVIMDMVGIIRGTSGEVKVD